MHHQFTGISVQFDFHVLRSDRDAAYVFKLDLQSVLFGVDLTIGARMEIVTPV